MRTPAKALARKALALPADQRVELAETLLASVNDFAPGVEADWRAEVARRVDEIEAGKANLVDAGEVHRRARAAIDEARRLPRRR